MSQRVELEGCRTSMFDHVAMLCPDNNPALDGTHFIMFNM